MKNRILSLVQVLTFAALGTTALADDYAPNQVLVNLKPGVDVSAINQTYHTITLSSSSLSNSYQLGTEPGTNVQALSDQMNTDPRIASASPNETPKSQFIFTADGTDGGTPVNGEPVNPSGQFIFTADADETPASQFIFTADGITADDGKVVDPKSQFIFTADRNPGFYAYTTQNTSDLIHYGPVSRRYTGAGILVAVLDTGISTRNPLLAQHVTNGWNFINNTSNADDSPSGIDSNGDGLADSDVGHGTMVAGLINRYAQGATLLPVKVLDSDGGGSLWATVEGIRYAMARGAKVINMSFGSPDNSKVLQDVIKEAWRSGIIVITAAGNHNTYNRQYPAGDSMTLAVGSLDASNVKASFSNYGGWVDVMAPGVNLPSTFWNGNYATWSGTSFSTPLVSAEAALIMSAQPTWSASKVRARIKSKATSVDSLNLPYMGMLGKGIVDLDAALTDL